MGSKLSVVIALVFGFAIGSTINYLFFAQVYTIHTTEREVIPCVREPIKDRYGSNNTRSFNRTNYYECPTMHPGMRVDQNFYRENCSKSLMTEEQLTNHHLCIVVAFRDSTKFTSDHGVGREQQLSTFKIKMREEMRRRQIDYTLIISEQDQSFKFNKGILFNLGFLSSYQICDYFIFHDIDLFPMALTNTYSYPTIPTHLVSKIGSWEQFQGDMVGGAISLNLEDFVQSNGFSNYFWGWGYEDNDYYYRIIHSGLPVFRLPPEIGAYLHPNHQHGEIDDLLNRPQTKIAEHYYKYCKNYPYIYLEDGLNSINASVISVLRNETDNYTKITFHVHDTRNLLPHYDY